MTIQKHECKYFPCHKTVENCILCFCPAYPCFDKRTGGRMWKGKVWDCSECTLVHKDETIKKIGKYIKLLIEEEYGTEEKN